MSCATAAARSASTASPPAPWSGVIGARAVIVQAVDERAKAFYGRFGFRPFSDREPLMPALRTSELEVLLRP